MYAPQVSFVRCGEGGFAVLVVNVDQLFAFVISDRTFTGRVIDTHFVVTGCRSNVITRVIDFRLIASPGIAITVDGQVTIRVHRDHTVAVVRLSDVVSTIVSQIGIQHKAVAVNVEDTCIHVTVSIGVAGQIQGISLQRIRGAVAHIQNAVVGDVDGVCIQCGIVHAPASRHIISNRDGTVVDCQFISCNMTIFIDIQGAPPVREMLSETRSESATFTTEPLLMLSVSISEVFVVSHCEPPFSVTLNRPL
ncbi:Uncharacterised protein [Citrobacter koseri]|uniref:Uncharacterized protein n=1 Tax=Citrobacter koseri TaxID=545 RepID=A0A3S4M8P8_CITKO|nr:Uncharacterised protein [Citrobacter koseri]